MEETSFTQLLSARKTPDNWGDPPFTSIPYDHTTLLNERHFRNVMSMRWASGNESINTYARVLEHVDLTLNRINELLGK